METKIVAVVILLVVVFFAGATTLIYYGSRIQEWRKIFQKAMADVQAEQENTAQAEKPKVPLGMAWVKRYCTVPLLLLAVFAAAFAAVSLLFQVERPEVLVLLVAIMLVIFVLETLMRDKQTPRLRFWVRLGHTIFLELVFVCVCYLLVSGFYFGTGFRWKSVLSALAIVIFFGAAVYRTQQAWYALLDRKRDEQNDVHRTPEPETKPFEEGLR